MRIDGERPAIQVCKMEKRWGSCTAKGAMLFNEELIKAPRSCIEYVMVHELCHLIEANHGPEFVRLLDSHMSDWRDRKARLEGQFS
jgi:predicted metal-dependent hydrolase